MEDCIKIYRNWIRDNAIKGGMEKEKVITWKKKEERERKIERERGRKR